MTRCIYKTFACVFIATSLFAQKPDSPVKTLPNAVIEEWRITAQPNHVTVKTNPPSLLWASEKKNSGRNVRYKIYLSQDVAFPKNNTIESKPQQYCFFNPHQKMAAGKWYWKYEIITDSKTETKGIYSFFIDPLSNNFETPSFEQFLSNITRQHPRVMNQGRNIEQIRKDAPSHPLYKSIIASGEKALKMPIFTGSVIGKTPAEERALNIKAGKELDIYQNLLEAYVLSGNKEMLEKIKERMNILLTWPTNDLLGAKVMIALAKGYDILYTNLSGKEKDNLLNVIAKQLKHGLNDWPGLIEARHVENHFWQMELAGNFIAALATAHDLPESRAMLEYTYELFLARFPNLATQEGGWSEGIGYFGVNKLAMVDMALLMKKIGNVNVFNMPWYKNLADYFLYFAPVDGRISGFGDMHDRVYYGNVGHEMMLTVGEENHDDKALYRLSALLQSKKQGPEREEEQPPSKSLQKVEPWYQIVNNIRFDANQVATPKNIPQARLFEGVGETAMHTNVLNSADNTAVYFRSSPFGAKGHMHANQNSFNISRKGEPVFYATGYYTSFADPHALSSYRHTRAHNGILINGMGQAFGHQGYGWIKRFINGENISYVCGDATMAYKPVVDKQFIDLLLQNNIKPTPENGYGDAKLKLFERHLVFLRPGTIIIYDILESEQPSEWTFLLHTMDKPELNNQNLLTLTSGSNYAEAFVTGSGKLNATLTDQFFSPAIDFKKKYKSVKNQYHLSYNTETKSKNMRFMAVIQLNDAGKPVQQAVKISDGVYQIGDIKIEAQLDAAKPPMLLVKNGREMLNIKANNTILEETVNGKKRVASAVNIPLATVLQ